MEIELPVNPASIPEVICPDGPVIEGAVSSADSPIKMDLLLNVIRSRFVTSNLKKPSLSFVIVAVSYLLLST